jgi:PadR family transcriptional regulator PadR
MAKTHSGTPAEDGPRLHGDLLTTSLLAMLRGWNGYGYQLAQRMKECGLPLFDQGTLYRTLRKLEESGLVSSFWDTSASGPARRRYSLTQAGEVFLQSWLDALDRYQNFLRTLWGLPPAATAVDGGQGRDGD